MTSDQDGFTLVELLVSMMLGLVILGTAFGLITTSGNATKKISDRVDSAQRGRTALERMTQQLRATVCVPTGTPVTYLKPFVAATATSVTWYANLDGDARTDSPQSADGDPSFDPQQRRLSYSAAARTIVEDRWAQAVPIVPATTAPTSTKVLLTDVDPLPGVDVFRYLGYQDAVAAEPVVLPPLTSSDLGRVVGVNLSFIARPSTPSVSKVTSAVMQGSVYARTINRNTDTTSSPYPTYACSA